MKQVIGSVYVLLAATCGLAVGCDSEAPLGSLALPAEGDCTVSMVPSVDYGYFPYEARVNILPGEPVTLTATANCIDGEPEFRLVAWGAAFSGVTELAPYGESNVFSWDSTAAPFGYNYFQVWVRRQGQGVEWEGVANSGVFVQPCLELSELAPTPPPPINAGTSLTFQFTTDCVAPVVESRWWKYNTELGWELGQDWSPSQQFVWDTSGLGPGQYKVELQTRLVPGNLGAFHFTNEENWWFDLTSCQLTSLTGAAVSPTSPAPPGSIVTIQVEPDCIAANEYKFWVYDIAAGTWSLGRDWGASATFAWDTLGLTAGDYLVQAWGRDYSQAIVARNVRYTLNDNCAGVTIDGITPASPAAVGVPVSFEASASCSGGVPEYRWWSRAPGGIWTLLQDWSPASATSWNTTGLVSGRYRIQVWTRAQGSESFYDGYDTISYEVLPASP